MRSWLRRTNIKYPLPTWTVHQIGESSSLRERLNDEIQHDYLLAAVLARPPLHEPVEPEALRIVPKFEHVRESINGRGIITRPHDFWKISLGPPKE